MSDIYITSDGHLDHNKDFIWAKRGFKSVQEMNEFIVQEHNKLVKPMDTVHHCGDFSFGNVAKWRYRLNGNITLTKGNHDKQIPENIFGWVKDYHEFKIGNIKFILSHYPMLTWNASHHGSIMLSGHTHSKDKLVRPGHRGVHVGVDAWDCRPVHIDEILALCKDIPFGIHH